MIKDLAMALCDMEDLRLSDTSREAPLNRWDAFSRVLMADAALDITYPADREELLRILNADNDLFAKWMDAISGRELLIGSSKL
jgi:hypothetical protein